MAITCECNCGASIRLPAGSEGKRARCKACGVVFTVPKVPAPASAGAGEWLDDFARSEDRAPSPRQAPLFDLSGPDDEDLCAADAERIRREAEAAEDAAAFGSAPSFGFWGDLAAAPLFPFSTGNLISFGIIVFAYLWMIPLQFAGIIGTIGSVLLAGYLCAFYMSTVVETASGEDELPTVWISNIGEDILMPLVRFIGSWLWVLLPAGILAMTFVGRGMAVPWTLVTVVGAIGLLHWPAVILALSIGGGFSGLWPHTMFRTALAAPLAYAAICFAVVIALGITIIPDTQWFWSLFPRAGFGLALKLQVVSSVLSAYGMVLAMRVIGLYYRHYKHRFPWAAE